MQSDRRLVGPHRGTVWSLDLPYDGVSKGTAKMAGVAKVTIGKTVASVGHLESTDRISLEALPRDLTVQSRSSDEELIRRVRAGETDCFEGLILRHRNHVGRIVGGHVPPDTVAEIAHEVFVKAFSGLGTYRFEEPFSHWLATIAVRTCYDFWRTQQEADWPVSALTAEHQRWIDQVLAVQSDEGFAAQARQQEARDVLEWALACLSPENRLVVTLVHLDGHSVREAAALLGWSVINVKVRAHRARRQLRNILSTEVARP